MANGTSLSVQQATQYAQAAGFSGTGLQNIVAIAQAESGLSPSAQNCSNAGGSCDRGILQINSFWHPEVSNTCAYDPACAFKAAFNISNGGTNFNAWTTFVNNAYQQFLGSSPQSSSSSTGSTPSGSVCDTPIIGWLICSNGFEQSVIITVGVLIVVIGLIALVMSSGKKK